MRSSALVIACLTAACRPPPATQALVDAPVVAHDGGEPGDSGVAADDGRPDATAGESESESEPGCTDAGPSVAIVEPEAGDVVLGASLDVVAEVTSTDDPVDPSSVVACLGYSCAPLVWDGTITYSGLLDIGSLAPGCDVLEVRADDEAGDRGCDSVSFVRDPGPSIEITAPDVGAFFGPDDVMTFGLTITTGEVAGCAGCADAACCTDGDPASCPCPAGECVCCTGLAGDPIVTIGPETCTPESGLCEWTESIATPIYDYTVSVSPADFEPDLVGASLFTVEATDFYGAAAWASLSFTVDAFGPAILIDEPAEFSIVGCSFEICASVTDPAGLNEATVIAYVNGVEVMAWEQLSSGTWCGLFDAASLGPGCDATPGIIVTAEDLLGNASSSLIVVYLDCVPPIAELDPPEDLRLAQVASGGDCCQCSHPFDPVGDDAVDDGDCVLQVFEVRARVEDRAIECSGADIVWKAGVDASGVDLIAYQGSEPLVVDSDADGWCDRINDDIPPEDLVITDLAPVPPGGSADFTSDTGYPAGCSAGEAIAPPDPLCDTTPLSVAIADYSVTSEPPALWAIPPIVADDVQCVGQEYESGGGPPSGLDEGWVCLAVRARDEVGNAGVSRPIRIYIDLTGVPYGAQVCPDDPFEAGDQGCQPNALTGPGYCYCDAGDSDPYVCDTDEGCCDEAAFLGDALPDCGLAGCEFPVFPPAEVLRVD